MSEEKHKAICCVCHKECEVPFKPRNPKTVMCGDCYKKKQNEQLKPSTREQTNQIMAECIEDIAELCFKSESGLGKTFKPEEMQALISTMFIQRCRAEIK